MILFVIIYIIRIIISIVAGFIQADKYDREDKGSQWYKGNKSIIYHKKSYFLEWMTPLFGWIWLLYFQFNKAKPFKGFFNE